MTGIGIDGALDPVAAWTLRGFVAFVFFRALASKLREPRSFVRAVHDYGLVPPILTAPVAATLLASEVLVAVALLVPAISMYAAFAAALLLGLYSAAIAINLVRGRRDIDCGCSGPLARQPLHEGLLVRNAGYAGAALIGALPTTARALGWLDATTIAVAVATLCALSIAADQLVALAARMAPLRGFR